MAVLTPVPSVVPVAATLVLALVELSATNLETLGTVLFYVTPMSSSRPLLGIPNLPTVRLSALNAILEVE